MTRLALVMIAVLAFGCAKPSEEDCRKAITNMQRLMGTDNLREDERIESEVRRCKGGSTKKAVQCAMNAQTLDDLRRCEFFKVPDHLPGTAAGSASAVPPAGSAGSAAAGSASATGSDAAAGTSSAAGPGSGAPTSAGSAPATGSGAAMGAPGSAAATGAGASAGSAGAAGATAGSAATAPTGSAASTGAAK